MVIGNHAGIIFTYIFDARITDYMSTRPYLASNRACAHLAPSAVFSTLAPELTRRCLEHYTPGGSDGVARRADHWVEGAGAVATGALLCGKNANGPRQVP